MRLPMLCPARLCVAEILCQYLLDLSLSSLAFATRFTLAKIYVTTPVFNWSLTS
jgi:hypothetical protein